VLLHWERDRPFRTRIPDAAARDLFLTEICTQDWHLGLDAGAPVDAAVAELSARHPDHAPMIRAYRDAWLETIPGPVAGTPAILAALVDDGHDVTALTNFNQDLFAVTVEAYPFLKLFRGVTVSGLERMIKPDPAIYARHADAFGLTPGATLFFDDSPPNVAAARDAGWNAEIFTDAARMRADLARYGIAV
jgi:2-haloacid dehalogenase